jgi:DNA-binding Lrp family transcriptional regulator
MNGGISHVTDVRSNENEQIEYAAKRVGKKGTRRRKVFDEIYRGKKNPKTAAEIADETGLSPKEVLDAGKRLSDSHIVEQTKIGKNTAYRKDPAFKLLKAKIQLYADNPKKLKKLPTKRRPEGSVAVKVGKVGIPKSFVRTKLVTVDELEQFRRVRKIKRPTVKAVPMMEKTFKKGIQKLLSETGKFQDWGGEPNDLHTTRAKLDGKRVAAAFAFKGRGKKGILTPAMMGKNGDQIARLFKSPATLYVLQYWDQVGEGIYDAMKTYATVRSINGVGEKIYYAVIDGVDSARILRAYPRAFR